MVSVGHRQSRLAPYARRWGARYYPRREKMEASQNNLDDYNIAAKYLMEEALRSGNGKALIALKTIMDAAQPTMQATGLRPDDSELIADGGEPLPPCA